MDIAILTNLKFKVEKDYHFINNAYSKLNDNSINNYEIDEILEVYKINLKNEGKKILQHKKTLLTNINCILMKRCNHNWIDDSIETPFSETNICYCNICFIYK